MMNALDEWPDELDDIVSPIGSDDVHQNDDRWELVQSYLVGFVFTELLELHVQRLSALLSTSHMSPPIPDGGSWRPHLDSSLPFIVVRR